MAKRGKLEIIKDILEIIKDNREFIKKTPLIRKSNLSTSRFSDYFSEMKRKGFVVEVSNGNEKKVRITEKGARFLERYKVIVSFIDEFEL